MSFIDLEKAYDRVNRESLWRVPRMYDVGDKLLNGIVGIFVNSLTYIKLEGGESERFRIDSGVEQVCILSP